MGVVYMCQCCMEVRGQLFGSILRQGFSDGFCCYETYFKLAGPLVSGQFCGLCFPSYCRSAGVTHALPHLFFYVGAENRTQTGYAFTP